MAPARVVIGIGNPACGDDGAGRLAARLLRGCVPPGVLVTEQDGEATALIECLRDAGSVWLIDAASSGAPVGSIRRVDCVRDDALPVKARASSHGFGVADAVSLARVLGVLPGLCTLYTIEGVAFNPGATMSAPVRRGVDAVVAIVAAELASA
ncbi:MAG TPA: hydrogenase maturation protease [Acetobacteraceae bacterium]|nr:hydrogenase maturation protease [Acetobacteraceae bacterium]